MDINYQAERHLRSFLRQWPNADPKSTKARIVRLLKRGQAWLWPEPKQLGLFDTTEAEKHAYSPNQLQDKP